MMILNYVYFVASLLSVLYGIQLSDGQLIYQNFYDLAPTPLPFPACRANDITCLRRGLRTFFFLMDSGHMGMRPIDPAQINSVVVAMPEQQVTLLLRNVNVTGARWTKLAERRFNLAGGKSGVRFLSDLHITGELTMNMAENINPFMAYITMDMQDVESNITYTWTGQRTYSNDDYIIIGPARIAVRNTRIPTFFLQPDNEDSNIIDQVLQARPSILDHLSNEVVTALMHASENNCSAEEYNLFGEAGQAYAIEIQIGHPYQKLNVIVDTGSATLAIASYPRPDNDQYFYADNSSSIYESGQEVQAKYSQGMWVGKLVSDYVSFPSLSTVKEVRSDIALITKSHNFFMNGSGWQTNR
ncbi:unnamed protein product, partial [Iphiclides podalirius]